MTFSLSASGDAACTASIFLWDDTASVVVSDIDGTITKYVLCAIGSIVELTSGADPTL